jgi:hypothetical protein
MRYRRLNAVFCNSQLIARNIRSNFFLSNFFQKKKFQFVFRFSSFVRFMAVLLSLYDYVQLPFSTFYYRKNRENGALNSINSRRGEERFLEIAWKRMRSFIRYLFYIWLRITCKSLDLMFLNFNHFYFYCDLLMFFGGGGGYRDWEAFHIYSIHEFLHFWHLWVKDWFSLLKLIWCTRR